MGLAAAHELHNFDLRAGLENRLGQLRLFHDAAVQFDGDPGGVKMQMAAKVENGLTLPEFAVRRSP